MSTQALLLELMVAVLMCFFSAPVSAAEVVVTWACTAMFECFVLCVPTRAPWGRPLLVVQSYGTN